MHPPSKCWQEPLAPEWRFGARAFTLLELLAVIAIVAILAVLLLPSIAAISGGQNLENAGRMLTDQMSLARQDAITRNRAVEFRLQKFKDAQDGGISTEIRAIQFLAIQNDGTKQPISKIVYLPAGIVISENLGMTSLVALPETTSGASDPSISRANGSYTYRSFTFFPDGSTDLSGTAKQFISARRRVDTSNPPKNYFTVSIEPTTGRTQVFRP